MRRREKERAVFVFFFFEHADGGRGGPFFFSFFFRACFLSSKSLSTTKRSLHSNYAHKEIEYNGGTFYAFRLFIPAIDLV